MDEKEAAMAEAERYERKLGLANRLVNALGSEQDITSTINIIIAVIPNISHILK